MSAADTTARSTYLEDVDGGRLLVVEDDAGIGVAMQRALENAGYAVDRAATVAAAWEVVDPPDLVLLDLGLPDGDGLDVAREYLRRWPTLPILMLTARAEEMDVVIGLDSGAADYLTKPFRLAELLARIRAQLRRPSAVPGADLLSDGDVEVDVDARRVLVAGQEVLLRAKEFDLLAELLRHKGQALTRESLMSNVWDEHWFGSTKTLDVHMSLRRRLGEQPGEPSRVTSLRGVGYRWEVRG